MDIVQRLEILSQIAREYDLLGYMEKHKRDDPDNAADRMLVDTIVNNEALYPVEYSIAQNRALERLGLINDPPPPDPRLSAHYKG